MKNIRHCLMLVLVAGMLGMGAQVAPAVAGMIGTDQVVSQSADRERLKALVARPKVAKKLETLGVLPRDAAARIDALTDEEVHTLAARIDSLPAGAMTDQNWLIVVVIVLLVAILIAI